ncbi:hypothetical protein [Geobacter argillaceus]|uniref:Uncharacterized protein n=1 Tax=Geobacter argillaceus TaxID=345631 RepID=A0A562W8V8_9BACT|nr:hypothetical protein [Geobacter argillaceus]TWJ26538.1 hypothetical protein JN12_01250 [Geobacter argillaceus]
MIKNISKWLPDSEPALCAWIVNECEIDDFLVVKELFESNPIYLMNNENPHYIFGYIYLYLHHGCNLSEIKDELISKSQEYIICSIIISIIDSLKNYDIDKATSYVDTISELNKGTNCYDKLIYCIEIFISINSKLLNDIVTGSIYGHITQKAWWLDRPQLTTTLRDISAETNKLPYSIKNTVSNRINEINMLTDIAASKNVCDITKVLSACCYSIVPYYIKKNHLITAFLLIHRSLDFYFASDAINKGLIGVQRDFLSYINKSAAIDDVMPRIHLYNTYFDYIAKTDRLAPNLEDIIRNINKKRNQLIHTHGVDSVSKDEIDKAYNDAGLILKCDQDWKVQLARFRTRLVVNAKDLIYESFNLKDVISLIK